MADEIIPAGDLPRATPGIFDTVVGVDESTGAARRFPMPIAGVPTAYETLADLPASAANGTPALVTNDGTAANNGLYRYELATMSWVKSADRVTELEGSVAATASALDDQLIHIPASNLYDPATMRVAGSYIAANNTIGNDAAWAYIKVPVTVGQPYAWASNTTRRDGATFLTSSGVPVAGEYIAATASAGVTITATAPATAGFLAINIKSSTIAEPTQMMVNLGTIALAYEAYHAPVPYVRQSKVYPDILVTLPNYATSVASANLYNPALKDVGKYVASNGSVAFDAAWGSTAYIPVTPGQTITISNNTTKRIGLAFYTAQASASYVAGSYNASESIPPLTVTVPATAAYLKVNLYSNAIAEPTQVMINRGSVALPYVAYGAMDKIEKDQVYPAINELTGQMVQAVLDLSPAGTSELRHPLGSGTFRNRFSPLLPKIHTVSNVWNFDSYALDGVVQSANAADDVAPYRVGGTTVGANHGYVSTLITTAAAHGKGLVDVGSVYTEAGVQWVIINVPDTTHIRVTRRTGNAAYTGATLTHVSGGTNTANIVASAKVSADFFPVHKNRSLTLYVDDAKISDYSVDYYPQRGVKFSESYDVLNKDSMVAWLITQAGTPADILDYSGTADFTVSHSYSFDNFGGMTLATDFLALQNIAAFQDIMFTQAYKMAATGGVLKYLIPDTLPLTHESVAYDFTKPVSMTAWAPVTRLDITPDRIANADVWPDRVIQFNGALGMAVGYLPLRDADPAIRPSRASRKALQISEIAKIYMAAIDSASRTSLSAGDYFGVVAYRVFFPLSDDRTASYVVRGPDADWLFVDWHASIVDRLPLPADLHGRAYTVHRKTAGVTIRTAYPTESIVFDVTTTAGAGQYAILKFSGV